MTTETGGLSLFEAARRMGVPFAKETGPASRFATANGLKFHYLSWGDPSKQPMLLLHGNAQTCHSWDFVCLAFHDRFHCMALDQRGHGDTDWDPKADYSLDPMVDDLAAIFDVLKLPPTVVVGLSMGGRNAFNFAARYPRHVRSLVIVDVGPEGMAAGRERIAQFRQLPDQVDSFEEFVERVHAFNPRRSREQLRGSLPHNVKRLPNGKWTWKYDAVFRDPNRRRVYPPAEEQWQAMAAIRVPTLMVRGAESDITNAQVAERVQQTIPGCTMAVVPRAGHLVPGDNPAGFIAAVRAFLEGQDGGGTS